jgi:hypothetical protein
MNRAKARDLARMVGEEVKGRTPEQIRALVESKEERVETSPGGKSYTVTIEALPDLDDGDHVQIIVSVDAGGWSALVPASWNEWIHL